MTSVIVVIGITGSLLGFANMDTISAVIIAAFIGKIGIKICWQGIQQLIDSGVGDEKLTMIQQTIQHVVGVQSVHQLRTRLHGSQIFIDVHIIVDPFISVSEGHHIGEQVYTALKNKDDHITDITVHIDPEDDETAKPSQHLPNRQRIEHFLQQAQLPHLQQMTNLGIHYLNGELYLDLYFLIDEINDVNNQELANQYQQQLNKLCPSCHVQCYYVKS